MKNAMRLAMVLGLVWFCYWGWTWWSLSQSAEAFDRAAYQQTSQMGDIARASGSLDAQATADAANDSRIQAFRAILDERDFARNMWVFGSGAFAVLIVGLWFAGRRARTP